MSIIGEGAYGTIYKPHLPCKNSSKTKKYASSIGKVFDEEKYMLKEKHIHNIVNKLDPKHKYTLPLYEQCTVVKYYDKYQLIYKYGGKDLKYVLKMNSSIRLFKKIFKLFGALFNGLKVLLDHQYAHLDIKPDNILFHKDHIYLIDFGIAKKLNEIYKNTNHTQLYFDYPYYPPEFKLFNDDNFEEFYIKYAKSLNRIVIIGNERVNYYEAIEKLFNINIRDELYALYKKKDRTYDPEKIDIFSVGIVLMLLFIWSGLSKKNTLLSKKFKEFIWGMINFDVNERYCIHKVLNEFDIIIKLF